MNKLVEDLNKLLATTATFAQKVSNLHWNMHGKTFMQFHQLTDDLYEKLHGLIDPIAEKIIMQGGMPFATLTEFVQNSLIKEIKAQHFSTDQVVNYINEDFVIYCQMLEKLATNQYVQPLYDEIFLIVDKYRWFFKVSQ